MPTMMLASAHHGTCCCSRPVAPQTRSPQPRRVCARSISAESLRASTHQLELELQTLHGMSAVLPGNVEAKQRVLQVIQQLELHNPAPTPFQNSSSDSDISSRSSSSSGFSSVGGLLGEWDLVYASNGTVVTRTGFAQGLVQLAGKLPGFGLTQIKQRLYVDHQDPGCVRCTNQAEFGLGPFGSWKVAIRGSWLATGQQQPSNTVLVVFDEFGVQLTGWLVKLPKQLPEVRIRLPRRDEQGQGRAAAPWQTTYLAGAYRVGRGGSGDVFLFRRCRGCSL